MLKNNKGFTLVELISTILILSIVLSVTGMTISAVLDRSHKKNYELLIVDIKSASELYYQECKYMASINSICAKEEVELKDLVEFGYLTSNNSEENSTASVINPITKEDISSCKIKVELINDKIKVIPITTTNCPTEY